MYITLYISPQNIVYYHFVHTKWYLQSDRWYIQGDIYIYIQICVEEIIDYKKTSTKHTITRLKRLKVDFTTNKISNV